MVDKVVDKVVTVEEAIADITDGAVVAVGGFGRPGFPWPCLQALAAKRVKGLTVIGLAVTQALPFLEARCLKKFISPYPAFGAARSMENPLLEAAERGEVEVEICPLGNLVEKLRAAGAGIPAFYTPVGADTEIEKGKEVRIFNGKKYLLETALKPDFAIIRACKADRRGNLVYRQTSRNLCHAMAKAASTTIAEVQEVTEVGELDPESVVTQEIYVDRIVVGEPRPLEWKARQIVRGRTRAKELEERKEERRGLTRELICLRASKELKPGMYVNLGIGMPAQVADFVEEGVILHTQNGALGFGPTLADVDRIIDTELVNAGGEPITEKPGISYMDCIEAFDMMRGGHLDVAIVGGLQVSAKGDLANWKIPGQAIGAPGGVMDLAQGARRVIVLMEHVDAKGNPKIVNECTFPITAKKIVSTIITDMAVLEVTPDGLEIREVAPGISPAEVQALTEPKLIASKDIKEMEF